MSKRLRKDKPFRLMHCFLKLQECNKWKTVRQMLNAKRGSDPSAPSPTSEGHPIGHMMAKSDVTAAMHSERVQSTVDKCVVELTTGKASMDEKYNKRWTVMMA
jgi:hypothetical protein